VAIESGGDLDGFIDETFTRKVRVGIRVGERAEGECFTRAVRGEALHFVKHEILKHHKKTLVGGNQKVRLHNLYLGIHFHHLTRLGDGVPEFLAPLRKIQFGRL